MLAIPLFGRSIPVKLQSRTCFGWMPLMWFYRPIGVSSVKCLFMQLETLLYALPPARGLLSIRSMRAAMANCELRAASSGKPGARSFAEMLQPISPCSASFALGFQSPSECRRVCTSAYCAHKNKNSVLSVQFVDWLKVERIE